MVFAESRILPGSFCSIESFLAEHPHDSADH